VQVQTDCIAAIDQNYKKVPESNFGGAVDYLAPGEKIMSTYFRNDNDIAKLTGTSQACAHATGAAAIFTFVSSRHWASGHYTENADMKSRSGKAWSTTNVQERSEITSG
jgi:subtilisin family serine protease